MKRISDGLFKGRPTRKTRAQRKADQASADNGEVWDEEFARSCSEDEDLSSYSLNPSDDASEEVEKPKSMKARLSNGLFKNNNNSNKKTRKERKRDRMNHHSGSSDDDPERIYDEDDVSSTSFASIPMQRPVAKRALNPESNHSSDDDGNNPRWSVAADKAIITSTLRDAASASSMVDEIQEDEDSDLYTSDEEEEEETKNNNNGGVVPDSEADDDDAEVTKLVTENGVTVPLSPAPSTTSHSGTSDAVKPKSKKKKKGEGGILDAHLAKTKKKKKKNGSSRSLKSTKSAKSSKSPKSKKKSKKKVLDTIESQGDFESFADIDKMEQKKSKKLKSPKKKKTSKKKLVTNNNTTEEDEQPVGELPSKKKQSSIWMLQDKIRHSLFSLTDSFMSSEGSHHARSSNSAGSPSTPSTRKLPSFSVMPGSPKGMRSSRNNNHKIAQPPMSPRIPEHEPSESDHYIDDDDHDGAPTPSPKNPEDIDVEKIKSDAVARIKAFAIMLGTINNQKEFLAAFEDTDDSDDEGDEDAPVSKKEKKNQTKKFNSLLKELQNFETTLEKERDEWSQERYEMKMKQESVEQLLNDEAEKNVMLQAQIDQLEERLENAGEAHQVEELKAKNLMLEAENELLQQKNERHEETIASLVREAETEIKRKAALGPQEMKRQGSMGALNHHRKARRNNNNNASSGDDDYSDEGYMELKDHEPDDDWSGHSHQSSGYMSMSNLGARAQGELLQLRSAVNHKDELLEEQAKEMEILRQEMENLREERHVADLTKYVENLENEKKFFVSEVDKLKKELTQSRKREQEATAKAEAAVAANNNNDTSPADKGGGWFGFGGGGGGDKEEKKDEATTTKDPLDLSGGLPKVSEEKPMRTASEIMDDDKPKRLSDLLDF